MTQSTILQATLQKSYYGKAKFYTDNNGDIILTSYNTDVLKLTKNGDVIRLWSGWSATTANHVNDFLSQNGKKPLNKKQWLEMPCENEKTTYQINIYNGFTTHTATALLTENEIDGEIDRIEKLYNNRFVDVWAE